jgi:hypothetical protein
MANADLGQRLRIDPALRNLTAAVAKRVMTLESYLEMPEFKVDIINIEAVKAAYIDGSLEVRPGYWTFWVGGRKKSNYVNQPMAIGTPHKVFQQWVKEENGYRVWLEYPVCSHLSARLYSRKTKLRSRTDLACKWLHIHLIYPRIETSTIQ